MTSQPDVSQASKTIGGATVALISLGRNAVAAEQVRRMDAPGDRTSAEVRAEADTKLKDARKSLLDTLTPWIPGDFVVSYGVLLTAWTTMRGSFVWLIVVAALSAVTFVILGAFAETGFRRASDRSKKVRNRLVVRTIVGFFVSVYAAVAIPTSGWYDFKWFANNELSCVVTAGIVVVIVVLALKGFQKRLGFSFGNA